MDLYLSLVLNLNKIKKDCKKVKRVFTCVKCEIKFTKEIPNERTEVICPICGTKQKFRYKVMGSGINGEKWEEADPWDDPDYWNFP